MFVGILRNAEGEFTRRRLAVMAANCFHFFMRLGMEFLAGSPICCSSRELYVNGREQHVRGARLDDLLTR